MKSRLLILLLGFFITFLSCSKEKVKDENIEITAKGINFSIIKEMSATILHKDLNIKKSTLPRNVLPDPGDTPDLPDEEEPDISLIVVPLIDAGQDIYADMVQQLVNTHEWQQLSQEDKDIILNFDDQQKAQLALFFSEVPIITEAEATIPRTTTFESKILHCAAAALGIREAIDIFENTRALMSAKNATRILKLVGKRYLGWVGLAYAVVEFVHCIE